MVAQAMAGSQRGVRYFGVSPQIIAHAKERAPRPIRRQLLQHPGRFFGDGAIVKREVEARPAGGASRCPVPLATRKHGAQPGGRAGKRIEQQQNETETSKCGYYESNGPAFARKFTLASFVMPRKSFSELINSPGMPVLVDFYADWCGPCKTMAPILQQVAAQHEGKLRIIKIDVDKNQAVAQQFRVQSIPTLILFHKGQPVWRQAGVVPAGQLTQAVSTYL